MTVWSGDNSEVLRLWIVIFGCTAHLRKRKVKRMDKKDKQIVFGLTTFLAILILACIVAAVVLLKKYGSMPVEEVPLWVWWFIS